MLITFARTLTVLGCIAGAMTGSSAHSQTRDQPLDAGAPILFGQPAALSGDAAALGIGMRDGIRAAFAEANRTGGVNGHALELISRDDGYDPNRSIEATRQLLEEYKVFGIIG